MAIVNEVFENTWKSSKERWMENTYKKEKSEELKMQKQHNKKKSTGNSWVV